MHGEPAKEAIHTFTRAPFYEGAAMSEPDKVALVKLLESSLAKQQTHNLIIVRSFALEILAALRSVDGIRAQLALQTSRADLAVENRNYWQAEAERRLAIRADVGEPG